MALNITSLAALPQLVKLTVKDKEIVKKYGDEIEFWVLDRQPIEQFIKMATTNPENFGDIITLFNESILNEQGEKVIKEGQALPTDVMRAIINQMVERLGK
jgi:hypothetical protein